MPLIYRKPSISLDHNKKCTSQGQGGRGRRIKIGMSTMNKSKRRSYKRYRGQGK